MFGSKDGDAFTATHTGFLYTCSERPIKYIHAECNLSIEQYLGTQTVPATCLECINPECRVDAQTLA
jgi:hypothetical protein